MKIDILVKFCTLFSIQLQFQRDTPHLQIKSSLYVCRIVQGSQTFKQNWIICICSRVFVFLVVLWSPCHHRHLHTIPIVPTSSPHCSHHPHIIPTPAYALWSPCCLCGFHLVSVVPTLSPSSPCHPCYPHVMPTSSRWSPHHPYTSHIPNTPTPTPLGGGGPRISENSIRFEIVWRFEICEDSFTYGWVHGLVSGWVNGWMGGLMGGPGQIIKNWINLDLIKIIQFFLKIYDLLGYPHLWVVVGWMGGLMDGSMGGSMGGVGSNH